MNLHAIRVAGLTLVVLVVAACGGGASSAGPTSAPPNTFDEFSTQFCGAFTSLFRAVGNPDANTPSVMSKALDDAVRAGDGPAADRAAAAMLSELEAGRAQTAVAARWQPTAATTAQLDRLFLAFEEMTRAKQARAHDPESADPGNAFEQAGGRDAWAGVVNGVGSMPVPSGASPTACKAFSGAN